MLDRYTARALMDLGQLSPEKYLRLYRNELRAQREKAERERHDAPARDAQSEPAQPRKPDRSIRH